MHKIHPKVGFPEKKLVTKNCKPVNFIYYSTCWLLKVYVSLICIISLMGHKKYSHKKGKEWSSNKLPNGIYNNLAFQNTKY